MKNKGEIIFHVLMIVLGLTVLISQASGQVSHPKPQTVLVGYHLERSWGAGPDITASVLFQTDALSLTGSETDPIPPDRLYNDLIGALAKQGINVRPRKDTLYILGYSIPARRDLVIETPLNKPKE